ncbi:hypothetical protein MJH12_03575 [bacterium]|nr:hypothetical protein [bacterium]
MDKFEYLKYAVSGRFSQNSADQSNFFLYLGVFVLIALALYFFLGSTAPETKTKKTKNFQNFYDFNVWILKNLHLKKRKTLMVQLISEGIFDLIQVLEWESFDLISKNFKEKELIAFVELIATRKTLFEQKIRECDHKELSKVINEMRVFTLNENMVLMLASSKDQNKFLGIINSLKDSEHQVFDLIKTGELIKTLRGTFMKVVFVS